MSDWEAVAAVEFRPRSGESDYVRILIADGNWSAVGHHDGRQDISIVN